MIFFLMNSRTRKSYSTITSGRFLDPPPSVIHFLTLLLRLRRSRRRLRSSDLRRRRRPPCPGGLHHELADSKGEEDGLCLNRREVELVGVHGRPDPSVDGKIPNGNDREEPAPSSLSSPSPSPSPSSAADQVNADVDSRFHGRRRRTVRLGSSIVSFDTLYSGSFDLRFVMFVVVVVVVV